ncbi:hypothetical protein QFZ75_000335 [Streptomyces sp. V3I8]|uniref:hypothetical protein n=1 Tax=Streptomyces sp. V3I8 TaxID=3042279 RepID=UPI0027877BAB|nr:hypothetical protein [Streptomyces sp. V3I8]MDQ1033919.1 hypothetical protein [Streptomyces sp. V3I8]
MLHPQLGELLLDCDVLRSPEPTVNILAYSAPPGSTDAALLDRVMDVSADAGPQEGSRHRIDS